MRLKHVQVFYEKNVENDVLTVENCAGSKNMHISRSGS